MSPSGDRFSAVQGPIVPLPIQEEEVEGEEEKVENTAKDTKPSASAHITLDEPLNLDPLRLEPPPSDISAAEDFLVVEEPVRPSFNGRTSRLARMTSRRISEAGNSVIVVSVPQPLSPVAGPSAFELAANAAVESHDRLSYSRSSTSRNPWAPLPGPPMSEGMVARRSVEGAPLLKTMDSMRIPRS